MNIASLIVKGTTNTIIWLLSIVCMFAFPIYIFGVGCAWYVVQNQSVYRIQLDNMREDWEQVNGRLLALEQAINDQESQNRTFYEAIDAVKKEARRNRR